jgi:hypothetical protein
MSAAGGFQDEGTTPKDGRARLDFLFASMSDVHVSEE